MKFQRALPLIFMLTVVRAQAGNKATRMQIAIGDRRIMVVPTAPTPTDGLPRVADCGRLYQNRLADAS